jgi:hypothetical protein
VYTREGRQHCLPPVGGEHLTSFSLVACWPDGRRALLGIVYSALSFAKARRAHKPGSLRYARVLLHVGRINPIVRSVRAARAGWDRCDTVSRLTRARGVPTDCPPKLKRTYPAGVPVRIRRSESNPRHHDFWEWCAPLFSGTRRQAIKSQKSPANRRVAGRGRAGCAPIPVVCGGSGWVKDVAAAPRPFRGQCSAPARLNTR